jgi:membrane-associated protease RseP (regulator of RpoE activity)
MGEAMKPKRVIAVAAVVALAGVGGMFVLAPELHGQSKRDRDWMERDVYRVTRQDPATIVSFAHGGDARIGVRVRDVEPSDVTKHKLAGLNGAVILEVDTGTPAARAGLKVGDVVVTFDNERVRSASQLDRLVNETPPGRAVKMSIVRDQAKLEIDITPEVSLAGAMPRLRDHESDSFSFKRDLDTGRMTDELRENLRESLRNRNFRRFATPSFEFDWDGGDLPILWGRGRLGVNADTVSGQLAAYFGVESGVLVREVDENSAAAKAGVKAGDVITAVNGQPVRDAGELRRQIVDATDDGATKEVTLSVTRDKKPITLKATIDDSQSSRPRVRRVV